MLWRAQSSRRCVAAIDRFTSNACDLIIEGESHRDRLEPGRKAGQKASKLS